MTENKKIIKWDIDKVRYFVEVKSGSGCKLLSGEYVNMHTKMEFRCCCGNQFTRTLLGFRNNKYKFCYECSVKARGEKGRKQANIFYDEFNNLARNEFTLLSKYKTNLTDIKVLCHSCSTIYTTKPKYFLREHRCKKCGHYKRAKKRTLSHKEFSKKVFELVGEEYTLLSGYIKARDEILMRHEKCGHKWEVKPNNFTSGQRCPKCDKNNRSQRLRHSICHIKNFVRNNSSCELVSGRYKNNTTLLDFICECGNLFTTDFSTFKHANKRCCDYCSKLMSKGERKINDYLLEKYSLKTERQERISIGHKYYKFDFYIESLLLIEYDGEGHFYPIDFAGKGEEWAAQNHEENIERDIIKNQFCISNNIPLIRIPYWEFDNIEYILDNVLKYFDIIEGDCENTSIVEKYYVGYDWDQEEYLSRHDRENREKELILQ